MPTAPESVLPSSGAASNPTAPSAVLATTGGGSAPAAPATVLGSGAGGSAPASPATVLAVAGGGGSPETPASILGTAGGGGSPAAPSVVLSSGGGAGLVFGGVVTLGGDLNPALSGELLEVATPEANAWGGQGPEWSSDGTITPSAAGAWAKLFKWLLAVPVNATLDEIAPRAGYLATGSQSTASQISVRTATNTWELFWLYDSGGGVTRWVDAGDAGMEDMSGLVIPAGFGIFPNPRLAPHVQGDFIGGLGASWAADPAAVWRWLFQLYNYGSSQGVWTKDAVDPAGGSWAKLSGTATGTPVITSTGAMASPAAVLPSYGGASAPAAPSPVLP